MILEIADLTIAEGQGAAFEAAVAQAIPHFRAARGCHGVELHRVHEDPLSYRLIVRWDSVEDHMAGFRGSEGFQAWRALASPFFARPPVVIHTLAVVTG